MEKIVLFSSMDAALAARKRMARACDPEAFATTYSTPRASDCPRMSCTRAE